MLDDWERRPVGIYNVEGDTVRVVTFDGRIYSVNGTLLGRIMENGEVRNDLGSIIARPKNADRYQGGWQGMVDTRGQLLGTTKLQFFEKLDHDVVVVFDNQGRTLGMVAGDMPWHKVSAIVLLHGLLP